jgi:hypothetical protein
VFRRVTRYHPAMDIPYVGFDEIAVPDATHDEQWTTTAALRDRAAGLIERARAGQGIVAYKLSGALAWLLYRAADLLDKARF